jgi:L-asparaginase II
MFLPNQPLLTIERSSLPEVTIYGVMTVQDGEGRSLVAIGDQNAKLWTRSCLKPWQLLNHLDILRKHYPALEDRHFALMLSSHSAQEYHLRTLDEIEAIGGVDDSFLQNTPLYPMNPTRRFAIRAAKQPPCSRWGSCSGKHMGFILALLACGLDPSKYLDPEQPHFVRMKKLLAHLVQKDWHDIPQTTDGCRLPNYALTAPEIARLYNQLARPLGSLRLPAPEPEISGSLEEFDRLKLFMSSYPQYVGGDERFDTELMQGIYTDAKEAMVIAKEGADGLLCIAVAPCRLYPSGLGIVIKSSSGDDPRYFSVITLELLDRLKLLRPGQRRENKLKHLNFVFHFEPSIHGLPCTSS